MKLIHLKSAWKFDSFDVSFSIKILIFRVSFTIEPSRSLLEFVTTNCLKEGDNWHEAFVYLNNDFFQSN